MKHSIQVSKWVNLQLTFIYIFRVMIKIFVVCKGAYLGLMSLELRMSVDLSNRVLAF